MLATLLAPGPSLSAYRPGADDGIRVGINRAATLHRCDVWAAGDVPMVETYSAEVLGTPVLLTDAYSESALLTAGKAWRGEVVTFQSLGDFCPRELQWDLFSATVAIVYAAWWGATVIRAHGMNWSGAEDFDGVGGWGNRTPERWELERAIILNRLAPWLAGKGIAFHRVTA